MGSRIIKNIYGVGEIVKPFINVDGIIYELKIKYADGVSFFNPQTVTPSENKVVGATVKYATDVVVFEEYAESFSALRYYEKEKSLWVLGNEHYRLDTERYENILQYVKNKVKKNWGENLKEMAMRHFADAPIDCEVIGDFDKFKIIYHPIYNWTGDEFRGSDTSRSAVSNEVVAESIENFDAFIFEDYIKEAFLKFATKVAELKTAEVIFENDIAEKINKALDAYIAEENSKGWEKRCELYHQEN